MKRLIAVWILCGLYTYGTLMAELDYENLHSWPGLKQTSRDNLGICVGIAATGPIGAAVAPLLTNFNQHGWELWQPETSK